MFQYSMVLAGIAVWVALYVYVIRPKLHDYRVTAGIYRHLDNFEGPLAQRALLHVKGAKVAIIGIVASALPVMGPLIAQLDGVDWTKILPTEKAQTVVAILGFVSAVLPLVMIALHQFGISDAARIQPCDHDHDHGHDHDSDGE